MTYREDDDRALLVDFILWLYDRDRLPSEWPDIVRMRKLLDEFLKTRKVE